jgi:hypothetical protein
MFLLLDTRYLKYGDTARDIQAGTDLMHKTEEDTSFLFQNLLHCDPAYMTDEAIGESSALFHLFQVVGPRSCLLTGDVARFQRQICSSLLCERTTVDA